MPTRMIRGADDDCIGPEMFEGQEKLFAAGFELITQRGAGHLCTASSRTHLRAWCLNSSSEIVASLRL